MAGTPNVPSACPSRWPPEMDPQDGTPSSPQTTSRDQWVLGGAKRPQGFPLMDTPKGRPLGEVVWRRVSRR